jgi:hypothetical protein
MTTTADTVLRTLIVKDFAETQTSGLNPGLPVVVVFILDDDTQTHRVAVSVEAHEVNERLADAPEGYIGEYVIRLEEPLSGCAHAVLHDADDRFEVAEVGENFDDLPLAA